MYESEGTEQYTNESIVLPAHTDESGVVRGYVRFAALGDSATYGVGDRVEGGWRGWAKILTDSVRDTHDISFCNLSAPGATTTDVVETQLPDAVAHRPHVAALVVGLNDTMRSSWDIDEVRENLFRCADELTLAGALLMTVRFHDHSRVLPLPKVLAGPMSKRIAALNEVYDEIHQHHGSLRVNLTNVPEIYRRDFWSVDRLHPSELGHRVLARTFAGMLNDAGLDFTAPELSCDGTRASRREDLRWLVKEGAPWVGRRARDLAPAAINQLRQRLAAGPAVLDMPA
ncbi:MAG TPA: SGNH/GDSL hydrolase family protein [Nocardioidaceae bacterium]|nr:SGNH/GDSL hydrolase family protein [Nocardioidaceae bacterium]